MLSYRCLLVASLWCEGGAGRVLLLDLFLRTWEGKKHVIVAAFFLPFSMKWILATANPQPTSVRLFCGYGWAAVLLLWSFGNFIPRQTLVCWVHGRVLSPSVCLPCVHALTHTHTHTHTHTPATPQSTSCNSYRWRPFINWPRWKDFLGRCCSLRFCLIFYFFSSSMHSLHTSMFFWNSEIGMCFTIHGYWDLLSYDKDLPWAYLYVCGQI